MNKTQKTNGYPEHFNINEIIISDKLCIANAFNALFTGFGPNLAKIITPNGKSYNDYLNTPSDSIFHFSTIEDKNTADIIRSLKTKSSCVDDSLSVKLLKSIKTEICSSVTIIINKSIITGIFPDRLKIAKVILILKTGDDTMLENYRPISILPAISKILEKNMFNQLHNYFHTNKLFSKSQFYGFRENHSTQYAALNELIDRIISSMDTGEIPFNIYIDLSKAFDTLEHSILVKKLYYYGVKDTALDLCRDYLENRKQYVQIDTYKSDTTTITTGVPQGSILGPLLFIIYLNDISKFSTLINTITYVDDTTLMGNLSKFKSNGERDLSGNINYELTKLSDWLKVNRLSLNAKKTKLMIFRTPQKNVIIPKNKNGRNRARPIVKLALFGYHFK